MRLQTDIVRAEAMIRCIGIEDLRARIQAAEDDKRNLAENRNNARKSAGTFCLAGGSTAEIDTGQCRFKSQRFRGKTAAVRGIR